MILAGRDEHGFVIGSAAQREALRIARARLLKRMDWPADENGKRWCIGPCELLLPMDDEHFGWNMTGRYPDGSRRRNRRRTCRTCWNAEKRRKAHTKSGKSKRRAQTRRYYLKHREEIKERSRRYWHEVRKVAA